VTLGGAVGGFQTFAAGIGNDNTTYYAISINTENEWEVGLGTLNADSSTLTRTTVLESSNSDSAVDFAAGSKEVFCTLPSEKAVYLDASDNQVGGFSSLVDDTTPQLGGDLDVNGNAIVSASDGDIPINANGTGMVTMTANSVTGDVIPGKLEGTNFTDSLLVGHATSGTLSTASNNTGVGIDALDALTSGDHNTAVGSAAGSAINAGIRNTVIGSIAGDAVTDGQQTTAVGYSALSTVSASDYNTAVGAYTLNIATGASNTALGKSAGAGVVAGAYNIMLGYQAGDNITSGDGNVCIGVNADPSSATGDRQLIIQGSDTSTTTTWISGDSAGTVSANGGELTTIGKALVMGF
jgi:hypothetical protein